MSGRPSPASATSRSGRCIRSAITRCGWCSTTCTPPASTVGTILPSLAAIARANGRTMSTSSPARGSAAIRRSERNKRRYLVLAHDDGGADRHAPVEVLDVVVGHAEAAGRLRLADRIRIVRAVDAIERTAEIKGA